MSAEEFVTYLTWVVYVLIFLAVAARAIRRPERTNIDIALFFAATTIVIALSAAALPAIHLITSTRLIAAVNGTLILGLAYLLIRLLDDFAEIPRYLVYVAGAGWLVLSLGLFLWDESPGWLTLLQILYLVGFQLYGALMFVREARRTSGVTQRRMWAIAAGSLLLGLNILVIAPRTAMPGLEPLWDVLSQTLGLASGISYFIGFAPPAFLRRAWQEPELRAFLSRAASLPRLPTTEAIITELERGAAASTGAPNASIGLWDEEKEVLRFEMPDGTPLDYKPDPKLPAGRAWITQQPAFSANTLRDNPDYAEVVSNYRSQATLSAPITAGERRLGVLSAYSPRAPIFAEDDLELVKLLADQAAVILESRALIDEAARVRGREEAARLKDDFLSAAAHDLKTPLTTLVAQTQLMLRRATRMPDAPADVAALQRMEREAIRLKNLVLELLDASRAEQGRLVGTRERVDLAALAQQVGQRHDSRRHPYQLETNGAAVVGEWDRTRIEQLLENLVENAVKYSPEGGPIEVKVWPNEDGRMACLTVSDSGIGIPATDVPHLFDRFYRGGNVDDRQFAGMGLGLFICQGIAEQHGGRIWASSNPNQGSTFHVELPLSANGGEHGG
ncbi:MAG TPA: ATP-binding protein [Ardenticatenaceae bacterium]|jgi:signal transduction histidine kinase